MKFDENLREHRKAMGLSQEELAEKLGVTRQTVSKWENGTAMPDLKKLTDIANLFNSSMDELLGTKTVGEEKENDNQVENFESYKAYAQQLFNAVNLNAEKSKKTHKTLCIVLGITVIALIIQIVSSASGISRLSDSVDYVRSQMNYMFSIVNSSGDFDSSSDGVNSLSDFVSFEIKKADKEKPYIVDVQFRYAPESYVKNSKVYFSFVGKSENLDKIEAVEQSGEFVLDTQIDLIKFWNAQCFVYVDDGNEIQKDEFYLDMANEYWGIGDYAENGVFYVSKMKQNSRTKYNFESDYGVQNITYEWSNLAGTELASARLVVESGGKELFSEELEISKTKDGKTAVKPLDSFRIDAEYLDEFELYVKFEDDLGIVYKFYPHTDAALDDSDYFAFNFASKTVTFKTDEGEKKIGEILKSDGASIV